MFLALGGWARDGLLSAADWPWLALLSKKQRSIWAPAFPFDPRRPQVHYGWVIAVAGAAGIVASIPGQTIGVNVFSERLIVDLGITRTQVSLTYFLGTGISAFLLPWAGQWFDRLGARRMVALGSVALGLSLFYMSVADRLADGASRALGLEEPWVGSRLGFLTFGFLLIRFWGQGVLTMTSRNMVGKWWKNHRGKVLSVSGIAVSVCFSLSPKIFDALIEWLGWREAWMAIGAVLLAGFTLFGWLVFRDHPEECGLEVDAGKASRKEQDEDPEFRIERDFTRKEALCSFGFWSFSLIFALQSLYFTAYSFHVVSVAAEVGLSKGEALNLFVPASILGGSISLFVGWASDRWRLKYMMLLMGVGVALSPAALLWGKGAWVPAMMIGGFGIASGCFGTLSGAFLPRFFGLKHLGKISGVFMSLLVLSSAIGPLVFSLCLDAWGSYRLAHQVAFWTSLALCLSTFWADNPQRKLAAARRG